MTRAVGELALGLVLTVVAAYLLLLATLLVSMFIGALASFAALPVFEARTAYPDAPEFPEDDRCRFDAWGSRPG